MSHLTAGIVLVDDDNHTLLVKQRDTQLWGIPKGTVEANEDRLEAAVRELCEEVGICPDWEKVEIIQWIDVGRYHIFEIYVPNIETLLPLKIIDPEISEIKIISIDDLHYFFLHNPVNISLINSYRMLFKEIPHDIFIAQRQMKKSLPYFQRLPKYNPLLYGQVNWLNNPVNVSINNKMISTHYPGRKFSKERPLISINWDWEPHEYYTVIIYHLNDETSFNYNYPYNIDSYIPESEDITINALIINIYQNLLDDGETFIPLEINFNERRFFFVEIWKQVSPINTIETQRIGFPYRKYRDLSQFKYRFVIDTGVNSISE